MEEITFKVVCKNADGSVEIKKVVLSSENGFTFSNPEEEEPQQ